MIKKSVSISFIVTIFFISCTTYRYTYSPAPPNNPVLKEKGEGTVSVSISSNRILSTKNHYSSGVNLNAAYALSNHFALTYSFNNKNEKDINSKSDLTSIFSYYDSSNTLYKRHLSEIGAGGFWFINNKNKWLFSLYGGYGWGNFSILDRIVQNQTSITKGFSAKTNNFFLQPSFTLITEEINLSLILKTSYLKYSLVNTDYNNDEQSIFRLNNLENTSSLMYEPSLNLQVKLLKNRSLLLNGGGGVSLRVSKNSHRWMFAYAGIGINPFKIFNPKK